MPLTIVRNKQAAAYGLLLGYNTDEMNLFLIPTGVLKKIKCPLVLNIAIRKVYPAPAPLIALFRKEYSKKTLGEIFSAILTSYQAQVPAIKFANVHTPLGGKTFIYEFAWPTSVKNGIYGSCHGVEMPFVFNNLQSKGERERDVGSRRRPTTISR